MEPENNVGHLAAFTDHEIAGVQDLELPDESDGKRYLTQIELLQLELMIERMKCHNERMRTITVGEEVRRLQATVQRKNSEISLLEAFKLDQSDPKVISAKSQLDTLIQQSQKAKDALVAELTEKYSITDPNFGFNPETGEIVEKLGGTEE